MPKGEHPVSEKKICCDLKNNYYVNMKRRVCTKQNMNKKIVPLHVLLKCSFKLYGHARHVTKKQNKKTSKMD